MGCGDGKTSYIVAGHSAIPTKLQGELDSRMACDRSHTSGSASAYILAVHSRRWGVVSGRLTESNSKPRLVDMTISTDHQSNFRGYFRRLPPDLSNRRPVVDHLHTTSGDTTKPSPGISDGSHLAIWGNRYLLPFWATLTCALNNSARLLKD